MKKYISPIGIVAVFLIVVGIVFKVQHWPGANLMFVIGSLLLTLFFLPVFGYELFYEFVQKKSRLIASSGAVFFILISLGAIFKIMHWPGATLVLVSEIAFVALFFLPALLVQKIKSVDSSAEKALHLFWYVSLIFLILGFGFKMQHWPGSSILLILGALLLTFLYIPIAFKIYNTDDKRKKLHLQLVLIVSGLVFMFLTTTGTSSSVMNSFVTIDDAINESTKSPSERLEMYYKLIDIINSNDSKTESIAAYYPKQMKVKELSDDLYAYINSLKLVLIKKTDAKLANSQSDSLTINDLEFKDITDIPSKILIGDPENPRTGAWSAKELKAKIFVFKKAILEMYEDRTKDLKESAERTVGMNLEDTFSADESRNISWEVNTFYNLPIAAVITILSKIQLDVRTNELATIQYLHNMSRNVGMPVNQQVKPISSKK